MEAPVVNVGIMTEKAVSFVFHGEYVHTETGKFLTGEQRALFVNGNIVYNGRLFKEIFFEPASPSSSFELKAVTIGRNFHWQRQEDQCFKGAFNLVTGENGIVVINQVDVEEYLTSVISSEMSAQASKELLKAHAVISRSWLLAQIEKNFRLGRKEEKQQNCYRDNEQLIRWYDREDHNIFDVCADDHCQRYQGITRASNPIVQEVIHETRGEILVNGETICDARFSKCCGGVTEQFEHCWELFYKQEELAELIHRKSGIDFGQILDLVPVNRGTSGRIEMLKIVGTHRTFTIGKELEIRRTLSETHLYSSAFVVDKEDIQFDIPGRFVLTGAGWGHGVGLCQIGAAMMAGEGYDYRQILSHYFSGASIEKRY